MHNEKIGTVSLQFYEPENINNASTNASKGCAKKVTVLQLRQQHNIIFFPC